MENNVNEHSAGTEIYIIHNIAEMKIIRLKPLHSNKQFAYRKLIDKNMFTHLRTQSNIIRFNKKNSQQ